MSDTSDSTTVMILFPDFEALKKEVEKLRTELSMLFLERDDLLYQECKKKKSDCQSCYKTLRTRYMKSNRSSRTL